MSEYASGYNNLPESPQEVTDYLQNVEGTLFEDVAPRQIGVRAIESAATDQPPAQRAPFTATEWSVRAARQRMQQVEAQYDQPETPYDELGGRRNEPTTAERIETVLQGYEPWMRDIEVAVERYGLLELTRESVAAMTKKDRDTLALYVDGFREGLHSARMLIHDHEGDVGAVDFFSKYGRHEPAEMRAYSQRLAALEELLNTQSGYVSLIRHAREKWGEGDQAVRKRHQVRRRNKVTKKNTPHAVYDGTHQKWRIELVALSGWESR